MSIDQEKAMIVAELNKITGIVDYGNRIVGIYRALQNLEIIASQYVSDGYIDEIPEEIRTAFIRLHQMYMGFKQEIESDPDFSEIFN